MSLNSLRVCSTRCESEEIGGGVSVLVMRPLKFMRV